MTGRDAPGSCRVCAAAIAPFMSFGRMPIANAFLNAEQIPTEYFFELAPAFCRECGTFQLFEQPARERMFHDQYAFFSSTSLTMQEHFKAFAEFVAGRVLIGRRDPLVVELGSNDGIMLRHFKDAGYRHLGIEPSGNVASVARSLGVRTIGEFFDEALAARVLAQHGPADAIVAANVMCHIPDIHAVAAGISRLLAPDGVLMFEDPYLGEMIAKTAYDQIYDEHVFMFSAGSVARAFAEHGLQLIDLLPQATHGGSMRYVLARPGGQPVEPSVAAVIDSERRQGLGDPATYQQFRRNCEASRSALRDLLNTLKLQGKRVVGYAATSKSTTVTNYCGIGPQDVEFIADTTPLKQGRLTPGSHIPVRPHEDFCQAPPDYALLFAWNHAKEIFAKEQAFRSGGGKWITFVPSVGIID
ncbi:MAG: class I SAM-dependent methyltransferase [Vicinamibacterales bacterium]